MNGFVLQPYIQKHLIHSSLSISINLINSKIRKIFNFKKPARFSFCFLENYIYTIVILIIIFDVFRIADFDISATLILIIITSLQNFFPN